MRKMNIQELWDNPKARDQKKKKNKIEKEKKCFWSNNGWELAKITDIKTQMKEAKGTQTRINSKKLTTNQQTNNN